LFDRLEMLREPALPPQFVYPARVGRRQVWYLMAGGQVVGTTVTPTDDLAAAKCLRRLRRAFHPGESSDATADRPARQIVSAWFRTHRDELQTILMPDEAMRFCQRLQVS
jgi:hypothetical protein